MSENEGCLLLRYAEGTPIANLWLSMAQAMGVKRTRIGDSTGLLKQITSA